jgi:hypothetical protein
VDEMGFIYLVMTTQQRFCKIGWTRGAPKTRLQAMATGCPLELQLIVAVRATEGLETALHREFSDLSVRGEWFHLHERILDRFLELTELFLTECEFREAMEVDAYEAACRIVAMEDSAEEYVSNTPATPHPTRSPVPTARRGSR